VTKFIIQAESQFYKFGVLGWELSNCVGEPTLTLILSLRERRLFYSLSFKGRVGVGMGKEGHRVTHTKAGRTTKKRRTRMKL